MTNQVKKAEEQLICPESTIDSAPRRDFIRKAALAAAGAGVGATVLGSNLLPQVSAKSAKPDCCGFYCNTWTQRAVIVASNNAGERTPGLRFGNPCSQEGISSNRICCNPCKNGLTFWTGGQKRMSIRNNGDIGIGVGCSKISSTLTVNGTIGTSQSVQGICNGSGPGAIYGSSTCGIGVSAESTCNVALQAHSCESSALVAMASNRLVGKFKNSAQSGDGSALVQLDTGCYYWNLGVAGCHDALCIPTGDFYIQQSGPGERLVIAATGNIYEDAKASNKGTLHPGASLIFGGTGSGEGISSNRFSCNPNEHGLDFYTDATCTKDSPRMSITNAGNLGVGTRAPALNLQIAGSFGAKLATVTSNYSMTANDFGILASATSGPLKVTLPPANTADGMIVFVKKFDSTTHAVTIEVSGSDKIEGKISYSLKVEYSSVTLVSDGSGNWYRLANGT